MKNATLHFIVLGWPQIKTAQDKMISEFNFFRPKNPKSKIGRVAHIWRSPRPLRWPQFKKMHRLKCESSSMSALMFSEAIFLVVCDPLMNEL